MYLLKYCSQNLLINLVKSGIFFVGLIFFLSNYNYMLVYIIIVVIVLLLLIDLCYKLRIEKFTSQCKRGKICIILTTFINNRKKYNMYLSRVKKWIDSGINIYLVDSGSNGYRKINKKNYKEYVFDQTKESYYRQNTNSSILEINSLLKIIDKYNLDKKYDYIYKITGKYFLEDYDELKKCKDEDLILQSRYRINWHNSELVGFKSSRIKELLNKILNYGDGGFEKGLDMLKKNVHIQY